MNLSMLDFAEKTDIKFDKGGIRHLVTNLLNDAYLAFNEDFLLSKQLKNKPFVIRRNFNHLSLQINQDCIARKEKIKFMCNYGGELQKSVPEAISSLTTSTLSLFTLMMRWLKRTVNPL